MSDKAAEIRMMASYLIDVQNKFRETSIKIKRLQGMLVSLEKQENHIKLAIEVLKNLP